MHPLVCNIAAALQPEGLFQMYYYKQNDSWYIVGPKDLNATDGSVAYFSTLWIIFY